MTHPTGTGADPVAAWREVYLSAPDAAPSVAASVAAALVFADAVWRHVAADPTLDKATRAAVTEGTAWARTALAAYRHLTDTGAYTHRDLPTPLRCWADENRLRTWLHSPSDLPGFAHLSVAQSWSIDDDFTGEAEDVGTTMATLVTQAQHAGMFGAPGYTVELRQMLATVDGIDTGDELDPIIEHQVTLKCPSGAVLASPPMAADHLAEDGLSGVDAAVAVLTNTALLVNELLTAEHRIIASAHDSVPERHPAARPQPGIHRPRPHLATGSGGGDRAATTRPRPATAPLTAAPSAIDCQD